jgi:hypothetical protein
VWWETRRTVRPLRMSPWKHFSMMAWAVCASTALSTRVSEANEALTIIQEQNAGSTIYGT